MSDPSASPVLTAMLEEFGDNAPFALELYARYRLDPSLVEEGWRRAFWSLEERVPFAMSVSARAEEPEMPAALPEASPAPALVPGPPAAAPAGVRPALPP